MATQISNAPAERLIRQSHRTSGRVTLWMAFGLGIASLIFGLWLYLNTSLYVVASEFLSWLNIGILLLGAVTLFSPVVILIGAMRSTAHVLRSQKRKTVPETNPSDEVPVRDLMIAVLYRWRLLLALVVGTMPLVVFGLAHLSIKVNVITLRIIGCPGSSTAIFEPGCITLDPAAEAVSASSLLAILAAVVGTWGLCLLAASLGVRLAAWWRQVYPSTLIMPTLLILAVTAIIAVLALQAMSTVLPIRRATISSQTTSGLDTIVSQPPAGSELLPVSVFVMLVPYALSAAIIFTAPRRVPSSEG